MWIAPNSFLSCILCLFPQNDIWCSFMIGCSLSKKSWHDSLHGYNVLMQCWWCSAATSIKKGHVLLLLWSFLVDSSSLGYPEWESAGYRLGTLDEFFMGKIQNGRHPQTKISILGNILTFKPLRDMFLVSNTRFSGSRNLYNQGIILDVYKAELWDFQDNLI